jgi:sugar lactone lactonase YvrE
MSDRPQSSESEDFSLLSTLRALFREPSEAMAMIAAARPWGEGFVLAVLLVAFGGLVEMANPSRPQALRNGDLSVEYRSFLAVLYSPWWVAVNTVLFFPILLLSSVGVCLAIGRLLGGHGSFTGLLATQAFALVPAAFQIVVSFVFNGLGVPQLGSYYSIVTCLWICILSVFGLRASLDLPPGRAIVVLFSPVLVLIPLVLCTALVIFVGLYSTGTVQAAARREAAIWATATREAEPPPTSLPFASSSRVSTPTPVRKTSTPAHTVQGVATAPGATTAPVLNTPAPARPTQSAPVTQGPPTAAPSQAASQAQIRKVDLASNDLVFDTYSGVLYASVPGSAPAMGNSIVPINPQSGALGTPIPVGSDPNFMALSDRGHYLYVTVEGEAAIQRVDLRTQQVDLRFQLGSGPSGAPYLAWALTAIPGEPEAVAVIRHTDGGSANSWNVAIFNNGVQLPATTKNPSAIHSLTFCDTADTLYSHDLGSDKVGLRKMTVDDSGVREVLTAQRVSTETFVTIRCANGRLYATTGQVSDAASLALVGTFGIENVHSIYPDTNGQVLFLVEANELGSSMFRLVSGDDHTFRQRWALDLPNFPDPDLFSQLPWSRGSLRRWGADGVAFRASPNQIWSVRAPQIGGQSAAPPATSSAAPSSPPPSATRVTATPAANAPDVRQIAMTINDLVYDPTRGLLYASVPSSDPLRGNSVVFIDPVSGQVRDQIPIGSEPYTLALSDDNQYLYVGLNGATAIRRIDLSSNTVDLTISLVDGRGGSYSAVAIVVVPGEPQTIVVGQAPKSSANPEERVVVYSNGQKRPQVGINRLIGGNGLVFCDDRATLYATDGGQLLMTFAFTADGVQEQGRPSLDLRQFGALPQMLCADGKLYISTGEVFDASTRQLVGTFPPGLRQGLINVDSSLGLVYFASAGTGLNDYTIGIYNQRTLTAVASLQLPHLPGDEGHPVLLGPRRLVRWGDDGLAFRTKAQLFIVRSPAIAGKPAATAPITPTTPPGPPNWPFGAIARSRT